MLLRKYLDEKSQPGMQSPSPQSPEQEMQQTAQRYYH
jgi:hypothetical protein